MTSKPPYGMAASGHSDAETSRHRRIVRIQQDGHMAHGRGDILEQLEPLLSGADILEMQQAVTRVHVDDSLVSYTLEIVRKTRESETKPI